MAAFDVVAVLTAPLSRILDFILSIPLPVLLLLFGLLLIVGLIGLFALLHILAPKPRLPFPSEKTYKTSDPSGDIATKQLPCWYDQWLVERHLAAAAAESTAPAPGDSTVDIGPYDLNLIQPAEVGLSVVVPAYNEELRMLPALEEMVEYCDKRFGRLESGGAAAKGNTKGSSSSSSSKPATRRKAYHQDDDQEPQLLPGYEIIIVNDASSDKTVDVALDFAQKRGLHDVIRVVSLERNRGKGGGVTHGFRHARGAYVAFADADGASRFNDLDKLIEGCDVVVDASERGVAIGSRAHLVGSEAVVKRSALRNFLMKSFHFVLTILTPPATSRLRDTQCGFKLFSRAALPHIVPYMHTEGWIFDIEMLMLAESAPATPVVAHDGTIIGSSPGIKVAEVPVAWHEVEGSKMNLVQDSIRMALGLTVLRASWMLGVYRRRLA